MQPFPDAPPPRWDAPILVGRDRELTMLRQRLRETLAGHGCVVLVAGEAGVGKSAVTAAISDEASAGGLLVLRGSCYDLTTTPPYGPWAEIIARVPGDDQYPQVPAQLRGSLGMAGIESQVELFDLTVRFLNELAKAQPVVMVLEDMHWADVASFEFLRYVSRLVSDEPMLIIVTYRDDELLREHPLSVLVPTLVREGRVERLHLQRLESEAVRALVRDRYVLTPADEDRLTTYLFKMAEGNPFYTKEFLYSLAEQRLLYPSAGAWGVGDLTQSSVPELIHQVVAGRLGRLNAATQRVLGTAAVVGFDVPLEILDVLYRDGPEDLDLALHEASHSHILMSDINERSARFNHALFRQSLYESLPPLHRQALHRRVGEVLAGRPRSDPATVATHFFESGDSRAVEWSLRAAERARRLFAPDAVIAECNRGLAAADSLGVIKGSRVYRLRGWAWDSLGDFERANQDLDKAFVSARQVSDPHEEWESLLGLAELWASRDYQKTGDYCLQAVALARTMDDPAALGHSLNRLGNWHMNIDQPTSALQYHSEALSIFEAIDDTPGLGKTLDFVAITYGVIGNATQSMNHYERAVPLLRKHDDRRTLSSALINAATFTLGSWTTVALGMEELPASLGADAGEAAEEAIRLAREIGWRSGEGYAIGQSGLLFARQGQLRDGFQRFAEALSIAEGIQHRVWLTMTYTNIGSVVLDLLVPEQAAVYLNLALLHATATGSTIFHHGATGLLATALIHEGHIEAAESLLNGKIDMIQGPRVFSEGTCWYAHSLLLLSQQQPDHALQVVDRVIACILVGSTATPPEWLRIRAEALLACGRLEDAHIDLAEAHAIAVARMLPLRQWRVEASLYRLYLLQGRMDEAIPTREAGLALVNQLARQLEDIEVRDTFLANASTQFAGPQTAAVPNDRSGSTTDALTTREFEVLAYIVEGRTDREIADALSISHRTVGNHVSNILGKLNVPSRTAAATLAIRAGLIS
jgi:DNA-binding CsgD family transcriptional regulator